MNYRVDSAAKAGRFGFRAQHLSSLPGLLGFPGIMSLFEQRMQARRACLRLVHTRAEQLVWDASLRLQRAFRRRGGHNGSSRQLNVQPFAIDLDVVARVHTVRVHPSFVCGLASDRAFYEWTVPPAPRYIRTTERRGKELLTSPAYPGRALTGRNTALQRLPPPGADRTPACAELEE